MWNTPIHAHYTRRPSSQYHNFTLFCNSSVAINALIRFGFKCVWQNLKLCTHNYRHLFNINSCSSQKIKRNKYIGLLPVRFIVVSSHSSDGACWITGHSTVCSTAYDGTHQRKHQSLSSLAPLRGIHRWPLQRTSNVENISMSRRLHD